MDPPAPAHLLATHFAGRCGLVNLGNTCFLNSPLQALMAVFPACASALWRDIEDPHSNNAVAAVVYHQLVAMRHSDHVMRPQLVLDALRGLDAKFADEGLHDACEAMLKLVAVLPNLASVLESKVHQTIE